MMDNLTDCMMDNLTDRILAKRKADGGLVSMAVNAGLELAASEVMRTEARAEMNSPSAIDRMKNFFRDVLDEFVIMREFAQDMAPAAVAVSIVAGVAVVLIMVIA